MVLCEGKHAILGSDRLIFPHTWNILGFCPSSFFDANDVFIYFVSLLRRGLMMFISDGFQSLPLMSLLNILAIYLSLERLPFLKRKRVFKTQRRLRQRQRNKTILLFYEEHNLQLHVGTHSSSLLCCLQQKATRWGWGGGKGGREDNDDGYVIINT